MFGDANPFPIGNSPGITFSGYCACTTFPFSLSWFPTACDTWKEFWLESTSGLCALIKTVELVDSIGLSVGVVRPLDDRLDVNSWVSLPTDDWGGAGAIPKISRRSFNEELGGTSVEESDIKLPKSWFLPNSPPVSDSLLNSGCWQPTKLHAAIASAAESMCLKIEG